MHKLRQLILGEFLSDRNFIIFYSPCWSGENRNKKIIIPTMTTKNKHKIKLSWI